LGGFYCWLGALRLNIGSDLNLEAVGMAFDILYRILRVVGFKLNRM